MSLGEGAALASEDEVSSSPSTAQVQEAVTQQAPVKQVVSNSNASPTGWDVDIFSCESQGDPSRKLAEQTAGLLAELSNKGERVGGQELGRIRLRSVNENAQQRLAPRPGNRVFGAPEEERFAIAVSDFLNGRMPRSGFTYSRTNVASRWYVSIFTCPK